MTTQSFIIPSAISPEVTSAAAQEAIDLWRNPETIGDICNVSYDDGYLHGVKDPRIGKQMHIKESPLFGIRPTLAGFAQDYPALAEVVYSIREADCGDLELAKSDNLLGFTIGVFVNGQWLKLHRDPPHDRDTKCGALTTFATLLGEGETVILNRETRKPCLRLRARATDVTAFTNEAKWEDRDEHTGRVIGQGVRINVGTQVALLSEPRAA